MANKNFKELAERYQGSRKIIIAGGLDETNLLNANFPRHVCNHINQISLTIGSVFLRIEM